MTVSPVDDGTRHFDKSIQYAWHVTSASRATWSRRFRRGTETDMICTFTSDTAPSAGSAAARRVKRLRRGRSEHGPASGAPTASSRCSLVTRVGSVLLRPRRLPRSGGRRRSRRGRPRLPFDAAGCPQPARPSPRGACHAALTRRRCRRAAAMYRRGKVDCFATLNVKAIVVQVDKTLLLSASTRLPCCASGAAPTRLLN